MVSKETTTIRVGFFFKLTIELIYININGKFFF